MSDTFLYIASKLARGLFLNVDWIDLCPFLRLSFKVMIILELNYN